MELIVASISSQHPVPVSRRAEALAPRGRCLARDREAQAARSTLNLGLVSTLGGQTTPRPRGRAV